MILCMSILFKNIFQQTQDTFKLSIILHNIFADLLHLQEDTSGKE